MKHSTSTYLKSLAFFFADPTTVVMGGLREEMSDGAWISFVNAPSHAQALLEVKLFSSIPAVVQNLIGFNVQNVNANAYSKIWPPSY